jgi:hypothetical protein
MSSKMRILITGTREDGPHCIAVAQALKDLWFDMERPNLNEWTIVHGDCPTGIDAYAQKVAESQGMQSERYPADWSMGKKAGPLRNKEMVDLGADLVLAFPKGASRGTRGCLKMAQEAGLKVVVYELDSTPEN